MAWRFRNEGSAQGHPRCCVIGQQATLINFYAGTPAGSFKGSNNPIRSNIILVGKRGRSKYFAKNSELHRRLTRSTCSFAEGPGHLLQLINVAASKDHVPLTEGSMEHGFWRAFLQLAIKPVGEIIHK